MSRVPIAVKSGVSGFSLIEVMVSLTLLVIGLMAILSMQMTAVEGNLNNMAFLEAINLRNELAERAQTTGADAVFDENETFQRTSLDFLFGADALGGLSTDHQLHGLTETLMLTDPEDPDRISGFADDNIRLWRGDTRDLTYASGDPIRRYFAVRLAVDDDFSSGHGLGRESVVRALITVFWNEDGELRSTDTQFFISRR